MKKWKKNRCKIYNFLNVGGEIQIWRQQWEKKNKMAAAISKCDNT